MYSTVLMTRYGDNFIVMVKSATLAERSIVEENYQHKIQFQVCFCV